MDEFITFGDYKMTKFYTLILLTLALLSPGSLKAEECLIKFESYIEARENYLDGHEKDASVIKCMAYAGDDRAATLYAQHLVNEFNDRGKEDDLISAYAWYRLSIDRAKYSGRWMAMLKRLEDNMPDIREKSNDRYLKLTNTVASYHHFEKKRKPVTFYEADTELSNRDKRSCEKRGINKKSLSRGKNLLNVKRQKTIGGQDDVNEKCQ